MEPSFNPMSSSSGNVPPGHAQPGPYYGGPTTAGAPPPAQDRPGHGYHAAYPTGSGAPGMAGPVGSRQAEPPVMAQPSGGNTALSKLHMPPAAAAGGAPPPPAVAHAGASSAGVHDFQPARLPTGTQSQPGPYSAPIPSSSQPPSFVPGPGQPLSSNGPAMGPPPSASAYHPIASGAPPMAGPPASSSALPPSQPIAGAATAHPPSAAATSSGAQPMGQRGRYPQPVAQPAATATGGQTLLATAINPTGAPGAGGPGQFSSFPQPAANPQVPVAQPVHQPPPPGAHAAAPGVPPAAGPGPHGASHLPPSGPGHLPPAVAPGQPPPAAGPGQGGSYPAPAPGPGQTRQLYPANTGYGAAAPGPQAPQQQQPQQYQQQPQALAQGMANMQVNSQQQTLHAVNVMADRTVLPAQPVPPPKPTCSDFRAAVVPDPEYIRSTLTAVPQSRQLLDTCRLPLGILFQPFRQMPASDLPLVRHLVMVRCTGCRAYFNPFVSFLNSHQWQCNLCFRTNEVPDSFYQADPRAENHRTRPELKSCSVEYLAPREYTTRPPPPATYVFVIEVTAASQRIGMLQSVCRLLGKHCMSLPGDKRRQISIITYGKGVTFYAFKPNAVQPQMYIVNDLEDISLPVPSADLHVNVEEFQEMLVDFFEQLPTAHQDSAEGDNCLGSAIQAAFQLVSSLGGRVTLFQASLPNVGIGALKEADPVAAGKEPKVDASSGYYKEQSLEFNQNHCAVDVFAFGVSPLDLATTSGVCKYSSGQVYYYSDKEPSSVPQAERFNRDLAHYLTRAIGFEAIMRLRCSYGVTIESFFGNFFHRGSDVLNMPNLNPDLTVGVQLSIEDKLPRKKSFISLQSAVLYTTHKGERRTRVTTLAIPITSNIAEVFDGADVEAVSLLIAKMACASASSTGLADAREGISTCALDCLSSYTKNLVGRSPTALLVPQALSTLPLFFTGLLNLVPFSRVPQSNDDRVQGLRLLDQLPITQALHYIYPRMYAIHDLGEEHATTKLSGDIQYSPARLQASMLNLSPSGIYLLNTGLTLFVWIGQSVANEIIQDLFDVGSFSELPETQSYLPLMENARSNAVNSFVKQLRKGHGVHAPLFIVRADSHSSSKVLQRLVDDGDHGQKEYSYYNFLARLQKAVAGS
ncbi:protein transport protein Sec24A-like isoform X1 [Sycon ciliatum]|uniref:protein transport protein Sec24A-like isoform X1 n=1 Tax=Sycon ciliatum TaxID=27933 RepID=UPI0031F60F9B